MEEQTIKVFTVEEANKVLPGISEILEDAQQISQQIKSFKIDIDNLTGIWGKDVLEKSHVDNGHYNERIMLRQKAQNDLAGKIEEMQKFGCIVKDVDNGLVDFYHDKKGVLVFLCWRQGEKSVDYWHTVDGGFASRASVK